MEHTERLRRSNQYLFLFDNGILSLTKRSSTVSPGLSKFEKELVAVAERERLWHSQLYEGRLSSERPDPKRSFEYEAAERPHYLNNRALILPSRQVLRPFYALEHRQRSGRRSR